MACDGDDHCPAALRQFYTLKDFNRIARMRYRNYNIARTEQRCGCDLHMGIRICPYRHAKPQKTGLDVAAYICRVADAVDCDALCSDERFHRLLYCRIVEQFQRILQTVRDIAKNLCRNALKRIVDVYIRALRAALGGLFDCDGDLETLPSAASEFLAKARHRNLRRPRILGNLRDRALYQMLHMLHNIIGNAFFRLGKTPICRSNARKSIHLFCRHAVPPSSGNSL